MQEKLVNLPWPEGLLKSEYPFLLLSSYSFLIFVHLFTDFSKRSLIS